MFDIYTFCSTSPSFLFDGFTIGIKNGTIIFWYDHLYHSFTISIYFIGVRRNKDVIDRLLYMPKHNMQDFCYYANTLCLIMLLFFPRNQKLFMVTFSFAEASAFSHAYLYIYVSTISKFNP